MGKVSANTDRPVVGNVDILKKALENIFIPFDKESDKIKFIKDICNEYENQLTDFLTKRDN